MDGILMIYVFLRERMVMSSSSFSLSQKASGDYLKVPGRGLLSLANGVDDWLVRAEDAWDTVEDVG